MLFFLSMLLALSPVQAKEIALSFDDAPIGTSLHFESAARTDSLIASLRALNVPPVLILSNPCRGDDAAAVVAQLKKYTDAGDIVGNHTCSHPLMSAVGYEAYLNDAKKADEILTPLFTGQKFFRFPYLKEGDDETSRNGMRAWLKENHYKNAMVSVVDDDYLFSAKMNDAKAKGQNIDYDKVQKLFIDHIMGAVNFYDDLAIKNIGYSPKHVLLLHEMDATVMFIRPLVEELRRQGWTIISAEDAYKDKVYTDELKNTYSDNGIISQVYMEKTGENIGYNEIVTIMPELDKALGAK